ncbi:alpha-glucosidase [Ponticaulis profundi]|uniref:Alpha-glucosidase n=1 Tax=Ponticaulis profundi TaxID=2665222 RepID=A0ABW1SFX5_9PROT
MPRYYSPIINPHPTEEGKDYWWRGASIYHVYPRSFLDSDGDGVGDIKGITEGLDHIASLEVDAIWISPFFKSPMRDFGYDVSDYCSVDPLFGRMEDFEELIEKAHALNLKIIIDQVYSHTSDEHDWFRESRQDQNNPKADWYVWRDAKPDGSPPNNWQSYFGGPAWQWDGYRRQYYLHNFLPCQPDLNVHNPEVQDALLDVARFWLEKGVDGFRLDAVNFMMHDLAFRDNPPSGLPMQFVTRPFDMQRHDYNRSHPGIVIFLERLRSVLDEYGIKFTVAEVAGPEPITELMAFTEGDRRLNSAYSFDFLYLPELTADVTERALSYWNEEDGQGWPSWAFSNHDAPRALTRWSHGANTEGHAKLYLLLLASLRGNIFIYQGEELALPQANVPFEFLQDPEAIENWPHTLGRDGARTAMPWNSHVPFGGFSNKDPWLPIDDAHLERTIDKQEAQLSSTLHFTRKIMKVRQATRSLRVGSLNVLPSPDGVLAIMRGHGDTRVLCIFNLTNEVKFWAPEIEDGMAVIVDSHGYMGSVPGVLPPMYGYWAQICEEA